MSSYFRRVIANRILRTLYKHGKLAAGEAERLERNVALLITTLDVKRKTTKRADNAVGVFQEPQFRLDLAVVAKAAGNLNPQDVLEVLPSVPGGAVLEYMQTRNDVVVSVKSQQFQKQVLHMVQNEGSAYGSVSLERSSTDDVVPPQTVLVEYSSPNIAKPFHAGHLRSTIIGNFIANLYQHRGHTVHRINYLGDWGTQFGLLALGFKRYGDEASLLEDPLLQLFKVYVQINQSVEEERRAKTSPTHQEAVKLFSRLEQGNPEIVELWKRFRQLSLDEYAKMYQRLGVTFTETHCESEYSNSTPELLKLLREKGLLKQDERGVGYVTVDDRGSEIKAALVKSDGASLYLTRDVAAALHRQEQFSPDIMHYVVEGGQQLHFRQLVGILRHFDVPWAKRPVEDVHVKFGRIEGMSSRRGTVVFLRDILDEARDRMVQSMKERKTTRVQDVAGVADRLAVSGVTVQDLMYRRQKNYAFSWDRVLSFSADSGVFLQYAHARLCSLLSSCDVDKTTDVDFSCLESDSAQHLSLCIARYPEVVEEALSSLEPCQIVNYLFRISHLINAAYAALPVKGEPTEVRQARLLLFDSARQVLSNGMHLIGIEPLTEM